MSNAIVSNVYRYVIDDVINQVRGDFEDMGIDDSVLQELQRSWETKVARSRVANFGFKEDGYYDEDGNNNNNNGGDGNALSNNNVNNNPNGQKAAQLPYPAEYFNNNINNNNNPHNNNGPSAASLASLAATTAARPPPPPQPYGLPPNINNNNNANNNNSRPFPDPDHLLNQYQMMQQHKPPHLQQQQHQHQHQQQQQNNNLPELQLPGIPRPNLPQNDGANDFESLTTKQIDQRIEDMIQSSQDEEEKEEMQISFTASSFSGEPLALDSLPDSVKQLMQEARERAIKAGAIKKRARIAQLDGEGDTPAADTPSASSTAATDATANNATTAATTTANDDDINSDLDDTDDEDDDGEGGEEIEHIILCLYDKVTRTKNKWKCILKDGIMLVNGRDYLFHRANGDFEW
ncbi:unnamed protein product [Mucor circinelloides]